MAPARGLLVVFFIVVAASATVVASSSDRIKHVIVLMEENRSFDHLLGWLGRPDVNGLNGTEYNLVNATNESSDKIYVSKDAPYVNFCDPDHSTPATAYKLYGPRLFSEHNFTELPSMGSFVDYEQVVRNTSRKHWCGVMDMFDTKNKLPVLNALANEFLVMDRMFASVPGPTWPNRQFVHTAQSEGLTETFPWYQNKVGQLYPQRTFYDQLMEQNLTWAVYYEDTPWELFLETLAHHPEHMFSMEQFYADAAAGTLPAYAFLNPRSGINTTTGEGSNDEHPDHDVALSEAHYKRVYEALRNGAAWNSTLFVLTYDEHGGFYDHVPSPVGVPPPSQDAPPSYPDDFRFDRLGVRVPTLLISPWVQRGAVLSEAPPAQKPFPNSEYDLTSIMASVRKILPELNGVPPLTDRDAWASTFEHVLEQLSEPRSDCPSTLPDPPPPTLDPEVEAQLDISDLQMDVIRFHANLGGRPIPSHLTQQGHISSWMQERYRDHRISTLAWKASKSPLTPVRLVPLYRNAEGWVVEPDVEQQWLMNHANATLNASAAAVEESVTTVVIVLNDTSYCLDGHGRHEGAVVGASLCYPSADPNRNRDRDQHWRYWSDSTLRPHSNASLCLTNRIFANLSSGCAGDGTLRLTQCSPGDVLQHYAYHGQGGNGIPGLLVFGDGLTVVTLFKHSE